MTKKPEDYINNAENKLKRHSLKYNYKNFGSPIAITNNSLKISFNKLEHLIREEFEKKNSR